MGQSLGDSPLKLVKAGLTLRKLLKGWLYSEA
jgi:hypothetical protein